MISDLDPSAVIRRTATIDEGTIVIPDVVVNESSKICKKLFLIHLERWIMIV